METKIPDKNPPKIPKYNCVFCNYITNNKKDFNKHHLTPKHIKLSSSNKPLTVISPTNCNNLICQKCDKEYKSRVGLWKHKKNCVIIKEIPRIEEPTEKELIMMLLKEHVKKSDELSEKELIMMLIKKNDDLQTVMMEVLKNGTHITKHLTLISS
jgi:hypothetical protein